MPSRQAMLDGVLHMERSVLDYGSGRGHDVRRLRHAGIDATGWDPYYSDTPTRGPADVVLLLYVLNVIEDAQEREQTLRSAWDLAKRSLVVSARLTWESRKVTGLEHEDGIVTRRGTFQRLFAPSELRQFVADITGMPSVMAAPGVVYAFREERDRLAFLARRASPDVKWLQSSDTAEALAAVVDYLEQRGRMPQFEEVPQVMVPLLQHLSSAELARLATKAADPVKVEAAARRTTLNTLLLLGMELFTGRSPLSELPLQVQVDIRRFFASYKEACQRADRLLLKIRDDTYLRGAMRNSVGKLTPSALYVHRRAVERLPVVLRLYEHCGAVAAGRPEGWDLVKLHHDSRKVSWLSYPDFDSDPHPRLSWSYSVDLKTLDASHRGHEASSNRPLLHRKHEFLAPDYEDVPKYRRLTDAEVRAGLYAHPHLIGTENGWAAELARCGRALRGHRLVKVPGQQASE